MAPRPIGSAGATPSSGSSSSPEAKATQVAFSALASAELPERPLDRFEGRGASSKEKLSPALTAMKAEAEKPLSVTQEAQLERALSCVTQPGDALRRAMEGELGLQAAFDVRTLVSALDGLSAAARTSLLERIAQSPRSSATSLLANVFSSPTFRKLNAEQKEQLAIVAASVASSQAQGLRAFSSLARGSAPNRLLATDSKGDTTLSHLAALAQRPLHATMAKANVGHHAVLTDLLKELATPQEINQAGYGTCTVTSMQFDLVVQHPAEYARLIQGLVGPAGKVEMAGGGTLTLQEEYYQGAPHDTRSHSEAVFQGAAMEFANGYEEYDAHAGESSVDFGPVSWGKHRGLDPQAQVNVIQKLFGKKFDAWRRKDEADVEQMTEFLRRKARQVDAPVLVSVNLGTETDPSGHVMNFFKMDEKKVYFRNPWGMSGGTGWGGLVLEDSNRSLYSMTVSEFRKRVNGLILPEGAQKKAASSSNDSSPPSTPNVLDEQRRSIRG